MVQVVGDEGDVEEDDAGVDGEVDALPFREGGLVGPRRRWLGTDEGSEREGNGGGLGYELAASLGRGRGGGEGGAGEETVATPS